MISAYELHSCLHALLSLQLRARPGIVVALVNIATLGPIARRPRCPRTIWAFALAFVDVFWLDHASAVVLFFLR
jgi:hypothetical protein